MYKRLRTLGYVSAKAGLLGLTRALAREYSPQGITVNTIAPGFMADTGATGRVPEEIVRASPRSYRLHARVT